MTERNIIIEKTIGAVEIGLLALAIQYCTPSYSYEASYNAFTDTITYEGTPSPSTILHEETHQERAHDYPGGRVLWGLHYVTDGEFACSEEEASNQAAGITEVHPACGFLLDK